MDTCCDTQGASTRARVHPAPLEIQEVLAFPEWKESVLVAEAGAIAAQDSKGSEADGASSHMQGAEASSGTIELAPAHIRVKCDEGEEVSDSVDASSCEAVPVEAGLVPDGIAHALSLIHI